MIRAVFGAGVMFVLVSFGDLLRGGGWWWKTALVIWAILGLGELLSRRWPRSLVIAAQLAVIPVLASAYYGISVLFESRERLREAGSIIWAEAPPVTAGASVMLVVLVGIGVFIVFADVAQDLDDAPLWTGVTLVSLLALTSTVSGFLPAWWVLAGAASSWLGVVLIARHPGGLSRAAWRRSAVSVVVVTASAIVAFPLLPTSSVSTWDFGSTGGGAFSTGVNPILELGEDLRRGADRDVLRYLTSMASPEYIKLATLSSFTGETWRPSEFQAVAPEMRAEDVLESDEIATLDIEIERLDSRRIPTVFPTLEIDGIDDRWAWVRPGGTAELLSGGVAGERYEVSFVDRRISLEDMQSATTRESVDLSFLDLPRGRDLARIRDLAFRVTEGSASDYEAASALQTWFRDEFEYSVTAPQAEGYEGNGYRHVVAFLEQRSGYCVHFASAMAVMARSIGLPARIAVGYAPAQDVTIEDGTRIWVNRSSDAHAWVEIHFDQFGWIQFDPTASVGAPTSFSSELSAPDPAENAPAPTPTPTPEADPSVPGTSEDPEEAVGGFPWRTVGLAMALMVLVGAPALVRGVRMRWRYGRQDPEPVWNELLDTALDLGIDLPASATLRERADILVDHGARRDELDQVVDAFERYRYGAQASELDPDLVRSVVASLRSAASRRERMLATMAPRSLL